MATFHPLLFYKSSMCSISDPRAWTNGWQPGVASLLLAVFPAPVNHQTSAWQAHLFVAAHLLTVPVSPLKSSPDARIPHCFFSKPELQFTCWLLYTEGPQFPPHCWLWSIRNPEHLIWNQALLYTRFATLDMSLDFPKLPLPWKEGNSNCLAIFKESMW